MSFGQIAAAIGATVFMVVLGWGLIRLYFAEKEASVKRIINMSKGDDDAE
jgi:hypothetical protein